MGDVSKATNRCSVCARPSTTHCAKCKVPYCSVACQTDAETNLGAAYAEGKGVARDLAEAERLWERAATKGNEDAKGNLALLPRRAP